METLVLLISLSVLGLIILAVERVGPWLLDEARILQDRADARAYTGNPTSTWHEAPSATTSGHGVLVAGLPPLPAPPPAGLLRDAFAVAPGITIWSPFSQRYELLSGIATVAYYDAVAGCWVAA